MIKETLAGLRVDVDTFRGTKLGVPRLLSILATHEIHASFFFTLGPDNMGRHLWRLIKPAFLLKMLRSNAASLYGWDILLAGTFWPGRLIGRNLAQVIQSTHRAGHEIGVHAWDHHKWQTHVESMSTSAIEQELRQAYDVLETILGKNPVCSAAAGWKCNEEALLAKEQFPFRYNSDCRGQSIFFPLIDGRPGTVQIPVTLPTYDELIGTNDVTKSNYNDVLLDMIQPGQLNVLTIHAEVEGIICAAMFTEFLQKAISKNIRFVPLGHLLPEPGDIPVGGILSGSLPGREGTMCLQHTTNTFPVSH